MGRGSTLVGTYCIRKKFWLKSDKYICMGRSCNFRRENQRITVCLRGKINPKFQELVRLEKK